MTLNASEEIVITSTTDEWTKVTGSEYTLVVSDNRTVTVEFKDLAGHIGSVSYTVANIDKIPATADVTYSNTNLTNQDVVCIFDSDSSIRSYNQSKCFLICTCSPFISCTCDDKWFI
mgnify:CR=1 FL=1